MITRRTVLGLVAGTAAAGIGFAGPTTGHAAQAFRFDWTAFDMARAKGGPVLIDITAPWCPTCKVQRAIVAELLAKPRYAGYTIFVVDYDSEKDIMRQLGARLQATLIVYKNGSERGRIVGDTRESAIQTLLESGV
ncbi:thioredoxin family protein [Bauldia sp.]|uniref:thioredoxin family protein n=1 Tax=Bauldia sp. TaxID=2575872 RepID=UPI003BA88D32